MADLTRLLPGGLPSATQRSQLVTRLVALGYRSTDLAAIVKANMTRRQIAAALIAVQRQAKKAN